MRGIISAAGYVPHHRLQRARIREVLGAGGGRGARAVASYDEDATTMAVEAARAALATTTVGPSALAYATSSPTYLDKCEAATVHAALRLDRSVAATDAGGSFRSATGALRAALRSVEPTLVVAADLRGGLPGSADESEGGDGAAAVLVGSADDGPLLAEHLGGASLTEELLDRWRTPGELRSRTWEERFGETRYVPLAEAVWDDALKAAGLTADAVDLLVVTGAHGRAVGRAAKALGAQVGAVVPGLLDAVGHTGGAHPLLLLASALEGARPGQVLAVVNLADGADAVLLRATAALDGHRPARPVAEQVAAGSEELPYARFCAWRGTLTPEPPRRPEPARASASAASRNAPWKFGFVGSVDRSSGALHLPPARVSFRGGAVDEMDPAPMAGATGTVATFTVDRLAWSPSPPVIFAVVDFDGGGRLAVELTDVSAEEVAIGMRVEMTFRRLNEADGVVNYFWKARPAGGGAGEQRSGEGS